MNDYISRNTAICVADYAADEHPYDKNREKPETYSDYNQGWNDACDFIRERLENAGKADVTLVRPELRKSLRVLEMNYERGLNSEIARDPLAWALYQTWKEIDGGADNAEWDTM